MRTSIKHLVYAVILYTSISIHLAPTLAVIIPTGDVSPSYDGTSDPWSISDLYSLDVAESQDGSLIINGGSQVISHDGFLARNSDVTSSVTLSGSTSTWTIKSYLFVGEYGQGELTIESGATVTARAGYIGRMSGASGSVHLMGTGSNLHITDDLYVGWGGDGALYIEDNATVLAEGVTEIGNNAIGNGSGFIHFDSGTLNTKGLVASPGALLGSGEISTNGLVSDIDLIFDDSTSLHQQFVFDDLPGQQITVNFDATDLENLGVLGAGVSGHGSLVIQDGKAVTSTRGYLGVEAGSQGSAVIDGIGSSWTVSGGIIVGDSGAGTMHVKNDGMLETRGGTIGVGDESNGSVLVDGANSIWSMVTDSYKGSVSIGYEGTGRLEVINSGEVLSGSVYIAKKSDSTGTVEIDGDNSSWTAYGKIRVGYEGSGELNITNGGSVTSYYGSNNFDQGVSIGEEVDSTGIVRISGPNASLTGSVFTIGDQGNGRLVVRDGGNVSTASITLGNEYGEGTLEILDGGAVTSLGACFIGRSGSTNNVVTVDGVGSTWSIVDSALGIGVIYSYKSAGGTLRISNGGKVTSLLGVVGDSLNHEYSLVEIDGSGSSWNIDESLEVYGRSDVNILNGGQLRTNTYGMLISGGVVTVDGPGSSWVCEDSIYLTEYGEGGTLNISNGGIVTIHGNLAFTGQWGGSGGVVNLTGGILDLQNGVLNDLPGKGAFNFIDGRFENVSLIRTPNTFIQSGGTFAPGGISGITKIESAYDLDAGTIEVELGGDYDYHDYLQTTGDINIASIGTTLHLVGAGPLKAGTYPIISAFGSTLYGRFEHITGLAMFEGLVDVSYGDYSVFVTLNWDYVPGDLNADGFVGLDDLDIILANWNQNVGIADLSSGDISGDGYIGLDDLDVVLNNWNAGTPPTNASALIPEPAVGCWMGLALIMLNTTRSARLSRPRG